MRKTGSITVFPDAAAGVFLFGSLCISGGCPRQRIEGQCAGEYHTGA